MIAILNLKQLIPFSIQINSIHKNRMGKTDTGNEYKKQGPKI